MNFNEVTPRSEVQLVARVTKYSAILKIVTQEQDVFVMSIGEGLLFSELFGIIRSW
jgi:hypothetical protein